MKKILLALTMTGLVAVSANAKNVKHHSKLYNENYKVCRNDLGYHICGDNQQGAATYNTNTDDNYGTTCICMTNMPMTSDNAMQMNNVNAYEGYYRRHNIVVSDAMDNPYDGLPSRQNDGVQKNDERNLNANQTSIELPGNDGSMPR